MDSRSRHEARAIGRQTLLAKKGSSSVAMAILVPQTEKLKWRKPIQHMGKKITEEFSKSNNLW